MKRGTKIISAALAAGMLVLGAGHCRDAKALELMDGKIGIYGYGDTSFNLSSKNRYLGADSSGDWNTELALLFTGKINSDLSVWAQLFGNEEKISLDWAFVDYRPTENLTLRAGQVKTPLGIYNEIRDIKYLQLSTVPPLMYHEEAELIDEAFQGASATYNLDLGATDLELTLFGGKSVAFEDDAVEHNQMIGGRAILKTPVQGLRLMASGFTSKTKKAEEGDVETGTSNLLIGSVDYTRAGVDLKAEYAYQKLRDEEGYAYYLQGGYTFFDKLTPFVRYDYLTNDRADRGNPVHYQKEFTVGVGYKFNGNISIKAEDHFITGYALPVGSGESDADAARKSWNLFSASINYIF